MPKPRPKNLRARQKIVAELHREMALERFQSEKPQMWLQSQRAAKLVEIQENLEDEAFPEGTCFLHASTVSMQTFALKRITAIDLDTCQVTIEIFGDEELEAGVVVLPLESIEWFGFPSKAVPIGIHFEGFTTTARHTREVPVDATTQGKKPRAVVDSVVRKR
jgi:hypothetical protein